MADKKKRTFEQEVVAGIIDVAAIILVLIVSSVLTGVHSGRGHSAKRYQAACASNEKLIGLAISQYAQDNDGLMPKLASPVSPGVTWRSAVYPYVRSKDVYQCPSRDDEELGADGLGEGYAANDSGTGVFGRPWTKAPKLDDYPEPERLIAVCEVEGEDLPGFNIDDPTPLEADGQILWVGHMGGSNYLFADVHVKWMRSLTTQGLWYRDKVRPLSANGLAVLKEAQERGAR